MNRVLSVVGRGPAKRALFASLFAVATLPLNALAQRPKAYDVQLNAGVVAEEGDSNIRGATGIGGTLEVMRLLPQGFAVGPSLSVAYFPIPDNLIISPGGCLGAPSCDSTPAWSSVRTAMLGLVGSYTVESPDKAVAPSLLAGFGVRHLIESPARDADVRPYAEIGVGATLYRRFIARIRYQATMPGSDLPKWSMPMTVGLAF